MNRRAFLALSASAPLLQSCLTEKTIPGRMLGPNHRAGHWLRDGAAKLLEEPIAETLSVEVLIVGGGVSGLSARRWLAKQGVTDVLLLELEEALGGNAASGQNAVSAFPWGAHYLPIPDLHNRELLDFLQQCGSITGYDDAGRPCYNEYHLCHDPEERLYINGHWQEGLVPNMGVPDADREQIRRFFAFVETLKHATGADGRDLFALPLDRSSADSTTRELDRQTFADYLTQNKFTSPYLRWYLDYACQDDYGLPLEQTSAWAGLHYFACRKGQAANATGSAVLTWPEGNGFLVNALRQQAPSPIRTQTLALSLQPADNQGLDSSVRVLALDLARNKTLAITAQKVILATPEFISQRLLNQWLPATPETNHQKPETSHQKLATSNQEPTTSHSNIPWLVANLTVDALPQGRGMPLCWDNVIYGSSSVGYICANHQALTDSPQRVITCYKPLTDNPQTARQRAYETTREQWLVQILTELEQAHPGLRAHVREADVWVWGHGMVGPSPGSLWHSDRLARSRPIHNRVFFAHSDYSGISLFEEAFYQGIRAAKEVTKE